MRVNTEFKEVKGVGRIPVDWEVKKLGEIADYINGKVFKPNEWANNGMKIIRIQNLNGSNEFNYFDKKIEQKYIINNQDLLFAWSGSRGTSFGPYIWNRGKSVLNQHIFKVELDKNFDKQFIYYSLKKITPKIEQNAHGSAGLVHVTKEELSKFMIPIPNTFKEQEKIAQILSNVDLNIEKTEEAIAKYKQVKKGLMDDLLSGKVRIKDGKRFRETRFKEVKGVGRIPWDWEVKELEQICNYVGRGKSPKYDEKSKYKVINQACIYWDGIKDINMKNVTKEFYESLSEEKKVTKGDILINSTGTGTLGRVIYYDRDEDITYDSHVTKVSIKEGDSLYYSYYFSTDKFQGIMETFCVTGSTNQIELQKSELEKRYVPVFDEKEQESIAQVLKHQDILIKKEIENLEKLKRLKNGLMEDLLTGKVRV